MIANYMGTIDQAKDTLSTEARSEFPRTFNSQFVKAQEMRYGENPHQSAAFYVEAKKGEAAFPPLSSCKARNCHSTTWPTLTPRWNA